MPSPIWSAEGGRPQVGLGFCGERSHEGCRVLRTPKSPEPVDAQSAMTITWRDLLTIC
jgi:hypothetical protein